MSISMFYKPLLLLLLAVKIESQNCGYSPYDEDPIPNRVGEAKLPEGAWPWMVAILRPSRTPGYFSFHCTGFLIDRRHVLIAAHSKTNDFIEWYRARIGSSNYEKGEEYRITEVVTHSGYSKGKFYDDIAILTLDREVYSPGFYPICLPDTEVSRMNFVGRELTVAGWVERKIWPDFPAETVDELQQLTGYTVINKRRCQRTFVQNLRQTFQRIFPYGLGEGIFCAKFKGEMEKACMFHSGVPAMLKHRNRWFAIGFISFGVCSNKEAPEGLTDIIHHLEWIRQNTKENTQPITEDEPEDCPECETLYQKEYPKSSSDCGISRYDKDPIPNRVGDEKLPEGAWPWMVAITRLSRTPGDFTFQCTGFLIDRRHVLLAAHCKIKDFIEWYRAHIGSTNYKGGYVYRITEVVTHTGYSKGMFYDDIAILTLDREVHFPDFNPICLPDAEVSRMNFVLSEMTVAGWVENKRYGAMENELQQLTGYNVVTKGRCQRMFEQILQQTFRRILPYGLDEGIFCAKFKGETENACLFHSGVPAMLKHRHRWFAIGFISFAVCANKDAPEGFTNITHHLEWIRQNTEENTQPDTQDLPEDCPGCETATNENDWQSSSDCGQSSKEIGIQGFLLEGERASSASWPWMVAIRKRRQSGNYEPSCAGALLDRRHVLSAAHCYLPLDKNWYRARIGRINQNDAEEYLIRRIAVHEGFTEGSYYDDIAILTLDRDVNFPHYHPICLPDQHVRRLNFNGRRAALAGWGVDKINSSFSIYLNQLTGLPIMSNERCQTILRRYTGRPFHTKFPKGIDRSFICAAFEEAGKDSCWGDSGGPLMLENDHRWFAIGIVSFGASCGVAGIPAGYTNVSNYLDWIRDNVRN